MSHFNQTGFCPSFYLNGFTKYRVMTDINTLNLKFGLPDQLRFVEGEDGFTYIEVTNRHAKAVISLYAAQILSYQPIDEAKPVLFLSEQAEYQQGKVIRGGTPVCWPWFSDERKNEGLPSHGLVRNKDWDVVSSHAEQDGSTKIVLEVNDDQASRTIWPYSFKLQISIVVGTSLSLTLTTYNTGSQAFTMSEALHTYFAVSDVNNIEITGLDSLSYLDKKMNFEAQTQQGNVQFDGEVDRIYRDVKQAVILRDVPFNRQIKIESQHCNSCVVWNPATPLSDVLAEGYKGFVCIESANVAIDNISVSAGEQHSIQAIYTVESL